MKKKLIILSAIFFVIVSLGITYSIYYSRGNLASDDQNIAKFIFNAKQSNYIDLPLVDLKPGDKNEYLFSVGNNEGGKKSDVTIQYEMTIKTYHFVPLVIILYKIDGDNEEFILECSEEYSRNDDNELVCNVAIQEMPYNLAKTDNYKLEVEFLEEYNDMSYSGLVDYINLEIKSWQK